MVFGVKYAWSLKLCLMMIGFEFETLMQVTGTLADCEGSKFGGPFFFLFLPILNMSRLSVCSSCLTVTSLRGFSVRFQKGSFSLERDVFLMSHFQFHFTCCYRDPLLIQGLMNEVILIDFTSESR